MTTDSGGHFAPPNRQLDAAVITANGVQGERTKVGEVDVGYACEHCAQPPVFTRHNMARTILSQSSRCTACRRVSDLPFSWLFWGSPKLQSKYEASVVVPNLKLEPRGARRHALDGCRFKLQPLTTHAVQPEPPPAKPQNVQGTPLMSAGAPTYRMWATGAHRPQDVEMLWTTPQNRQKHGNCSLTPLFSVEKLTILLVWAGVILSVAAGFHRLSSVGPGRTSKLRPMSIEMRQRSLTAGGPGRTTADLPVDEVALLRIADS